MPRPSKTLQEYQALARAREMIFIPAVAPHSTRLPTLWQCPNCGRVVRKSYNKMRYDPHPCRCRTPKTLKRADYLALADRLRIEFVGGPFFPKSNKEKTVWRSAAGQLFEASYHELSYGHIPQRYLDIIEGA